MGKIIKIVFLVCFVALIGVAGFTYMFSRDKDGNALSSQEAADKAIKFITERVLGGQATTSLMSITEENGLYKFHFQIQNQEYDSYISKDGKLLLYPGGQGWVNIEEAEKEANDQQSTSTEAVKSDKPDVKVFVMSYCPYGLQAQKMMLPVYDLLKDKADIGVYFVSYAMHEKKELDENLTQYCIEKDQKTKYSAYLSCFVKAGDSTGCLKEAKIDTSALATCVSETDTQYSVTKNYNDKSTWLSGNYPKFDVQADLNTQYGVQGSPTIIINGTVANVGTRSPENFKNVVCQAFNNPPEECSQTLSSDAPSAGLGVGTGASSDSSCGN